MAEVAKALAEATEPSGESQGAEVKTKQPTERILRAPLKQDSRFSLRVSEVLLRAITSITSHKGLPLATLKKELGHAGYQMRRKCCRHSGEVPKSDFKGTLMRISDSNGSGYFRVWKIPKPKRKPGRPKLEEGAGSPRRTPVGPRVPRKRRVRRMAAKKARQEWRRNARAETASKMSRPRPKNPGRSRAKEERRTKVTAGGKGQTMKGDKPRTRDNKRPRKKQQDSEKSVKRTIQKSPSVKTILRAARTSTKPESPRNPAGNP